MPSRCPCGTEPASPWAGSATLARDHGIGRSTGYRYIDEATDALANQAPDVHHALNNARAALVLTHFEHGRLK
ncbi:hypothetical protein [Nocardiopsis xinjiangensis]|uniref:hypothetical protein n=1 Tax=Nocardiopsis xinjiangensis TaxID=124285 RepID=UPI000346003E